MNSQFSLFCWADSLQSLGENPGGIINLKKEISKAVNGLMLNKIYCEYYDGFLDLITVLSSREKNISISLIGEGGTPGQLGEFANRIKATPKTTNEAHVLLETFLPDCLSDLAHAKQLIHAGVNLNSLVFDVEPGAVSQDMIGLFYMLSSLKLIMNSDSTFSSLGLETTLSPPEAISGLGPDNTYVIKPLYCNEKKIKGVLGELFAMYNVVKNINVMTYRRPDQMAGDVFNSPWWEVYVRPIFETLSKIETEMTATPMIGLNIGDNGFAKDGYNQDEKLAVLNFLNGYFSPSNQDKFSGLKISEQYLLIHALQGLKSTFEQQ